MQPISEKGLDVEIDQGVSEGASSLTVPLDVSFGSDSLRVSGGIVATTTRIPIARYLWRFRARVRNLTSDNLDIKYQLNDDSLVSVRDPSSKIGVSIFTRKLDVVNRRNVTLFDAYVDLIIDYSTARLAGNYTGSVTITVECNP